MGLNYSAAMHLGFIITWDELMAVIRTKVAEEVYCDEDRYDPKTGQKTTPVRTLVSCAKYDYRLGGELLEIDEEDDDSFYKVLGKKFGAEVRQEFGEENIFITVPSSELTWIGDGVSCGRVTFGAHLSYESVLRAAPRVEQIRKTMTNYGFKLRQPLIIMETTIG